MREVNGNDLRALRNSRGKSAMEVAYASKINVTYLYKLEKGTHRVEDDTARRIASTLAVSVDQFSRGVEVPRCEAVKLAEREGVSRIRIYQYLNQGRVAGAYKDGDYWVVPEDAHIDRRRARVGA